MNKALPLFDATGSSVMFPDSLATECALSDSRLKQKKVTISVIHTPVCTAGKWLGEKKSLWNICHPLNTYINSIIAKFIVSCCAFCKLQRNFGFSCSVNHLSGPLRKQMFTCDWCISIHFVCFCVSRFVACDRPVSGNNRLVFFEDFSDLSYSCLLQE